MSKYKEARKKDPLVKIELPGLTWAYKVARSLGLQRFSDRLSATLAPYIIGSGMKVSPKGYASLITLLALISPISFYIIGYLIKGWILGLSLAIASVTIPGIAYLYPVLKHKSRGDLLDVKILNLEAALATSFISASAHEEAFLNLLPLSDVLGFDVELREIARGLVHERLPLSDALIRAAEITPSRSAALLFEGLKGIIDSGAGILEYIYWMASSSYNDVESKYRAAFNSLSVLMELYMALVVLMPIVVVATLVTLFGVGGFFPLPVNPRYLISLVSFVLTPFSAIGILLMADSIVSRLRP